MTFPPSFPLQTVASEPADKGKMRQRVTFLLEDDHDSEAPPINVTSNSVKVNVIGAAKEHQLSISLDDLPRQLRHVLDRSQELYVRWVSVEPHSTRPPFTSRLTPGLHVFYTPRNVTAQDDQLCPSLKALFSADLKCSSPTRSFTSIPALSERSSSSSSSTAFQYHAPLSSIDGFVTSIESQVCGQVGGDHESTCQDRISAARDADYLDINFDAVSQSLIVSAFWHRAPTSTGRWSETISNEGFHTAHKLEVGVLRNEDRKSPEGLTLGGLLTVVGEGDKSAPTRFSFLSRHHLAPNGSSYEVSFVEPTGLHPTLRIALNATSFNGPSTSCALHAYLTLPSYLFVDRYQLSDPLFLASKNLREVQSLYGETSLEDPDWVIDRWGSNLLAELATPHADADKVRLDRSWTVDVPLHLRYLPPTRNPDGVTAMQLPWPAVVFWACPAAGGLKMHTNPFDRVHVGYDTLFEPQTMFYHWEARARAASASAAAPRDGTHSSASSSSSPLTVTLRVPVLRLDGGAHVEWVTIVAVLLGFAWISWTLFRAVVRPSAAVSDARSKTDVDSVDSTAKKPVSRAEKNDRHRKGQRQPQQNMS